MDEERIYVQSQSTGKERAREIMRQLENVDLPEEMLRLIHGWMASDINTVEKEKYLSELFDSYFSYDRQPQKWVYEHLNRFRRRVGTVGKRADPKAEKRSRLWKRIAVAAAIAIPLGAGSLLFTQMQELLPEPETVIAVSPETAAEIVSLPDGSTVRLRAGSKLSYSGTFSPDRTVSLTGEGFFSVARMENHPFTVKAGEVTVTVLGTEFNFRAYEQESETVVSLASGRVDVDNGNSTVTLEEMTQYIYRHETRTTEITPLETELVERQSSGKLRIDGLSLERAIRALGRFYGMGIEIDGNLPGEYSITTILYESRPADTGLYILRELCGARFEYSIENGTIYIRSR